MSTSSSLEPLIAYFREHQAELAISHHGQFVLIHGKTIVGYYDEALGADEEARRRGYKPGEFLIAHCVAIEEEKPVTFHSRVA